MTDPKAQRLVKHARDLFAYLGKKYSMSPQHVAEADDWIERLERSSEKRTRRKLIASDRHHRKDGRAVFGMARLSVDKA
jgi:hypothetical protein